MAVLIPVPQQVLVENLEKENVLIPGCEQDTLFIVC